MRVTILFAIVLTLFAFTADRKGAPAGIENKLIPLFPSDDTRACKDFVYVEGGQFRLRGEIYPFKGVNYYPSKNCWQRMWEYWDPAPINAELALLENLGVNTVRVFLDYKLFERHRVYGDYSIMLVRLDELLRLCETHGMRALITPFVWGSANIETDKAHIRHIVSRFKDDSRVFGWDVSNELDHGWRDNPKLMASIQAWAAAIFAEVKAIDPNHPVTVGDYGWYLGNRDDPYGSGISLDLSKMSVPLEVQDFICFHWYSHYYALDVALMKLKEVTGKPIVIEELGLPTGGVQNGVPWHLSEQQVSEYYFSWLNVAAERGAYLMPWCGFDFVPYLSPYPPDSTENYWGLYDVNYRLKPSGIIFRDFAIEGRKVMKMLTLSELKKIKR